MAVYTEVSPDALARFIEGYELGRVLDYRGIADGVENTNYRVDTERGQFFLTLFEKRVDPADLPFFLGLMEHLARAGLSCPTPVRDRHDEMLTELMGRPATLITFLKGTSISAPKPHHCTDIGQALATLHRASADFSLRRANALGPSGWAPLFARFKDHADEITPGLARTIADELSFLAAHWPRDLPQGVIHADLFPDNAFFLDDKFSGMIDFYFACNDALAYDLAVCLNAWCFDPQLKFDTAKGGALIEAYENVRPLTATERAALPILARGAALRFLLTRAYDWINTPPDALVARKDPGEYLEKLRFHQSVASLLAYGLGT